SYLHDVAVTAKERYEKSTFLKMVSTRYTDYLKGKDILGIPVITQMIETTQEITAILIELRRIQQIIEKNDLRRIQQMIEKNNQPLTRPEVWFQANS
ncbi:hypothetical protein AVEN_16398-1, partial [Araneus ventricosus]